MEKEILELLHKYEKGSWCDTYEFIHRENYKELAKELEDLFALRSVGIF